MPDTSSWRPTGELRLTGSRQQRQSGAIFDIVDLAATSQTSNTVAPVEAPHQVEIGRRWIGDLLAVVGFAILTLVFFWPAVTGGAPFSVARGDQTGVYPWAAYANGQSAGEVQADQALLSYPWDASLKSALSQGTIPLWSAGTFDGGYPLYPNGSSAELYPPRIALAAITSPEDALAWFSALNLFFGGLFAYLFARSLRIRRFGAFLTGISWMFASFNVAWLPFAVLAPILALLPLDLLLVRRAWQRKNPTRIVLAGSAIGLTMMAGHIVYMGLTVVIALGYGGCLALDSVFKAWRLEHWRAFRYLLVPAGISVVGLGIAAVTLLPTVENLAQLNRSKFAYSSLYHGNAYGPTLAPPSVLLHAFVPVEAPLTIASLNLNMAFAGTLTACLAIVGFVSRRPGAGIGRILVIIGGLGAIGGPITWLLYHSNPLLQVEGAYGRLFEWWAFGLALLGGLGLDRVLLWIGHSGPVPKHHHNRRPTRPTLFRVFAVGGIVLALTAAQLVHVSNSLTQSFNTFGQSEAFPQTPLITSIQAFQKKEPWPARVAFVTNGNLLLPSSVFQPIMDGNIPQIFAIDQAGGYDSAIPPRTLNLQLVLGGESVKAVLSKPVSGAFLTLFYPTSLRYDLLERTGIAALAAPPALDFGTRLASALPGSTTRYDGKDGQLVVLPNQVGPRIVDRAVVVDSARSSLATFTEPSFDFRGKVVLERSQLDRLPPNQRSVSGSPDGAKVVVTQAGTNNLTLQGHASGSGWLVIPENLGSWMER